MRDLPIWGCEMISHLVNLPSAACAQFRGYSFIPSPMNETMDYSIEQRWTQAGDGRQRQLLENSCQYSLCAVC